MTFENSQAPRDGQVPGLTPRAVPPREAYPQVSAWLLLGTSAVLTIGFCGAVCLWLLPDRPPPEILAVAEAYIADSVEAVDGLGGVTSVQCVRCEIQAWQEIFYDMTLVVKGPRGQRQCQIEVVSKYNCAPKVFAFGWDKRLDRINP